MNKYEFQEAVLKSPLNETAKLVMLGYLHHCKQAELKESWPSLKTIAVYANCGRDTAKKYVDALETEGWLVKANLHEDNIQGYEFGVVAETVSATLMKKGRNMNPASFNNLKPMVAEAGSTTNKGTVAERMKAVAESKSDRLQKEEGPVAETGSARKEEEKNLEKKEEKTASAQAPRLDPVREELTESSFTGTTDSSLPFAQGSGVGTTPIREDIEEEKAQAALVRENRIRNVMKYSPVDYFQAAAQIDAEDRRRAGFDTQEDVWGFEKPKVMYAPRTEVPTQNTLEDLEAGRKAHSPEDDQLGEEGGSAEW